MAKDKAPTPAPKPKSLTPTATGQAAGVTVPDPLNANPPRSISGLTEADVNGSKVYYPTDPYTVYAKLTAQEAITLKANLAKVVGAYPRGREPKYLDKVFRDEDFAALAGVMGYADRDRLLSDANSPSYVKAILKLQNNPAAAASYFSYKVPTGPSYNLTPLDMAAADFSAMNRSVLGSDATPKEIAAYHSAVNKLETKQKGQFSASQRDALIISFIQKKAASLVAKASNPDDKDALNKISTGDLGGAINGIRATYQENGISFTEDRVRKQAVAALRDEATFNNTINDIRNKAAVFVPAFKDAIYSGKSARDVLSPYISMYAKTYDIPEDQVKLDDVFFAGAGEKAMMPKDFNAAITSAPKFKETNTYKAGVASSWEGLAKRMGIEI
jgi:hypothetical protein